MKLAWSLLERRSIAAKLLLVSLVAVLFLAFPESYQALNEGATFVFKKPFLHLKLALSDLSHGQEKIQRLKEALMQALVKINTLEQQKEENERLRAQLGFEPPAGYRLIPLEAITVEYNGPPVAILVNRGRAQGLAVGLPVINRLGLIGRIEENSARFARVQLLTDPGCRVAGRVAVSREQGIVRYEPSRGLILDNLPIDGQIKQGDLVISSGLGGVFPEGLPVAVVEAVLRDESEMFADVLLRATVNFNAIDELYALIPIPGSAEPER